MQGRNTLADISYWTSGKNICGCFENFRALLYILDNHSKDVLIFTALLEREERKLG